MTSYKRLLDELQALAPQILFGSASTTYRTCGMPGCVCQTGARHGLYLHASYRAGGRTAGYYVPAARRDEVLAGPAAWARLQEVARKLAEHHRRTLIRRRRSGGRR